VIKTNKIVVLGGGSAGWMTAATLIKAFPNKDISVIESDKVPTVGVGESTLGKINSWLNLLGIKDKDFMPYTDASYKLSIRFEDFYKKGDGGFHYPFGVPYENNLTELKQNWFFKNAENKDYADFISPNMALVNNNRIADKNVFDEGQYSFKNDVAYHFDATKFGKWLKENYCIPKGVNHINDFIQTMNYDDSGIVELIGEKSKYTADLYIDCTGFGAKMIQKTGSTFMDYSDLLPNNKAWATRVPYTNKEEQLEPFTNCTAMSNGWVWNIPSWERIGTGYVYSDKYTTDLEALEEFKEHLHEKGHDFSKSKFKNITMRVGRQDKIFNKNVCAIGLSAGFIEPLESNGLLSVHEFLIVLVDVLNRNKDYVTQTDKDSFNNKCGDFFDEFTDFVACHYAFSIRQDSEYWKDITNKSFLSVQKSNDIKKNIAVRYHADSNGVGVYNSISGMHYLSTGFNYYSVTGSNLDYMKNTEEIKYDFLIQENNQRDKLVERWNEIAKKQPTLLQYLKDNIHGDK